MTAWQHPTWAAAFAVPSSTPIRCACGRLVSADMVTDGRALPPTVRPAHGDPFFCDGCRETLHREGILLPSELASALGAPADVVAQYRGRDRAAGAQAAAALADGRSAAERAGDRQVGPPARPTHAQSEWATLPQVTR